MTATLACASCRGPVASDALACPHCHSPMEALVFPALVSPPALSVPGQAQEGEASCFYHPANKAAAPCDQCGRFLCALCQVDFLGQIWCPNCIQLSRQKGRLRNLDASRTLYGNAALALSTVPLLFWPVTLMTAPMALYVSFRYWKAPTSLVRTQRWQFIAAVLFSTVELGAWVWLTAFLVSRL